MEGAVHVRREPGAELNQTQCLVFIGVMRLEDLGDVCGKEV